MHCREKVYSPALLLLVELLLPLVSRDFLRWYRLQKTEKMGLFANYLTLCFFLVIYLWFHHPCMLHNCFWYLLITVICWHYKVFFVTNLSIVNLHFEFKRCYLVWLHLEWLPYVNSFVYNFVKKQLQVFIYKCTYICTSIKIYNSRH